ncbi:MAG: transferrin-binding protein-like solute binding protein [Gammaproteobacteria bacterium]|nr:transferrin-binding protein-like solute binding protein [Gammaproteobacteria bacterium]
MTFEDDTDYQPIMEVNGVEMVQTRGVRRGARTVIESGALIDSPVDFVGYGAWMDYSGFFAEGYLYDDTGNGRKQEAAAWTLGIRATGSLPLPATGAFLSWEGAMVGMVVDQTQRQVGDPYSVRDFDPVQGDAEVTIDDAGELRVAITDIFYLNQSGSIPNLLWAPEDIYGGVHHDESDGTILGFHSRMRGAFYGPNHEEVAGTFEKRIANNDWLFGAFGAKRVK